jgi:hypothetical protein
MGRPHKSAPPENRTLTGLHKRERKEHTTKSEAYGSALVYALAICPTFGGAPLNDNLKPLRQVRRGTESQMAVQWPN